MTTGRAELLLSALSSSNAVVLGRFLALSVCSPTSAREARASRCGSGSVAWALAVKCVFPPPQNRSPRQRCSEVARIGRGTFPSHRATPHIHPDGRENEQQKSATQEVRLSIRLPRPPFLSEVSATQHNSVATHPPLISLLGTRPPNGNGSLPARLH